MSRLTPDTAIHLERALGISIAVWLGLEFRYREARAREHDSQDLYDLKRPVGSSS
jgi:plasmid maintenance system antidote protein VapI